MLEVISAVKKHPVLDTNYVFLGWVASFVVKMSWILSLCCSIVLLWLGHLILDPKLKLSEKFFDQLCLGNISMSDSNWVRFLLRIILAILANCKQAPGFLSKGFLPPAALLSLAKSPQRLACFGACRSIHSVSLIKINTGCPRKSEKSNHLVWYKIRMNSYFLHIN